MVEVMPGFSDWKLVTGALQSTGIAHRVGNNWPKLSVIKYRNKFLGLEHLGTGRFNSSNEGFITKPTGK